MARRGRNLAGLAALGALGFMAGKGLYKRPGEKLASVEDKTPVPAADRAPVDMPYPETDMAQGARIQRFVDFSDDQEPGGSTYRPAAPAAPAARRVATPRAAADTAVTAAASDEVARGRGMNRAPTPAVIGPRSTGAGGSTAAEMAAYRRQQMGAGAGRGGQGGPTAAEMDAYRRQQELDAMRGRGYSTQYKKGGVVKASPKKVVSAGASSASKRADGIAQRGKTRGKMY